MKEVIVLSGKGGTGKTSIVGSLAVLAGKSVITDCDVDAADLHLLLQPDIQQKTEFWSGQIAEIDRQICTECGLCETLCRFNAIHKFSVDQISCEGCGFCFHICPVKAITMKGNLAGHWFISGTDYGLMVHARMGIAQENSGKLVAQVRQQAKELAQKNNIKYIISDGPPGIGCPVISSLSGASLALVITEPTLSGIHDMERVLDVCRHFNVQPVVCINKFDINLDLSSEIEKYCLDNGIPIGAKIPFDKAVTEAMVRGLPIVNYIDNDITHQIKMMWQKIINILESEEKHANL